jgi:hypothetical protein
MRNKKAISYSLIISLLIVVFSTAILMNVYASVGQAGKATKGTREVHTFTGSVSQGYDSSQHEFTVPSDATLIEIELSFSGSYDFDLSLWDNLNRRTGGWTRADHSTKTEIPNSAYSGYSANPEWVNVDPPSTSGTWKTGCYSYRGSGSYTITVTITVPTVDTTPPTVSITAPSDGATVSGSVTITASASDNVGVSYVQCRIDSGAWTDDTTSPYSWTWDTTGYSDGSHTITCRAYDAAGNYADDIITVTVDNTAPPQEEFWGITSSSFTSSSTHAVIRYMGGTSPGVDSTITKLNIRVSGSGTVSIALYTGGSLSNPTGAVRRTEAHNVAVVSGWNEIDVPDYVVPAGTITWIGWAHNCRVYYSSSSSYAGDFQTARGRWSQSSPSNYDETTALPTSPGSGSFSNFWYAVHATYIAGEPPVDTTPPSISITSPSDGATVSSSDVTVTWSGSDAGSGIDYYEIRLNGGSWINKGTSTSHTFTGLADATHSVDVRAWDVAGNDATDSVSFTVDTTTSDVTKYAVIVGISDYKAISDLSYCDEDAADWYNFLDGASMNFDYLWVYGDGHTSNYPKWDGYATEYNIKQALINMVNLANSDDIICFLTSGHGSGNGYGSSYICAWDCGSGESGEDGDFYDTELESILDGAVAEKIFVFIDHCYSGGFGPNLMSMPNSANVYVAVTCSDSGYGYDYPAGQNGAWTYFFLEVSWINHYGGSASTALETVFDYALANYPYGGANTPEEYDGNTGQAFYLT